MRIEFIQVLSAGLTNSKENSLDFRNFNFSRVFIRCHSGCFGLLIIAKHKINESNTYLKLK